MTYDPKGNVYAALRSACARQQYGKLSARGAACCCSARDSPLGPTSHPLSPVVSFKGTPRFPKTRVPPPPPERQKEGNPKPRPQGCHPSSTSSTSTGATAGAVSLLTAKASASPKLWGANVNPILVNPSLLVGIPVSN